MKGIIFTEFLTMVESNYSADLVDTLIEEAKPASGGAYTAVGTYPHTELVGLLVSLNRHTGKPVNDLLEDFGRHLFKVLNTSYPQFTSNCNSLFDFLGSIENHIHVEVLKLYPDAQLPRFETKLISPDLLEMIYSSDRHLGDLAHGLIAGAAESFSTPINISRTRMESGNEKFMIQLIKA